MYKSYNFTSNSCSVLKSTQDNTINVVSMLSMHENQAEAIQREIDNYTGKLEQQKRKFFSIQDTYKDTLKELDLSKQKLHESRKFAQTPDSAMNQAKLKNLKGNFDKMRIVYDQTIAYNYKLKSEIDKLRRDKKILLNLQDTYQEEIVKKEEVLSQKQDITNEKQQKNQAILSQIQQIKRTNDEEKEECNRKIEDIENQYSDSKRFRQTSKLHDKTQKAEIIDTHPVLKLRLKKVIAKNKETVKSLDKYQKHLSLIENAFNEIKEGSGVQDLDEITETFIKAEQQNASLYKYTDTISQNINSLETYNKALLLRIEQEERRNRDRREHLSNPTQLEVRKKEAQIQLKQKEEFVEEFNTMLSNINPRLEKTLIYLANSKWNLDPTKAEEYKLDFNVTDLTIQSYLSDLEKFANSIVQVYHLRNANDRSINEQYSHQTGKSSTGPSYNVDQWKDEKDLLGQKEFKRFAEDYLDKKKYKPRQ